MASEIESARTIVASLAPRPYCQDGSLDKLTRQLTADWSASLAEMRLSVRALNIAEARGIPTLKQFMALTTAEFEELCQAPMASPSVRREYYDLRQFMIRPVGDSGATA